VVTKVLQQEQLVLPHLAQRRGNDRTHREAVIKVGTEVARLDLPTQVAVGGGNDARLADPLPRFPEPLILAIFQHAQQLGL
jgi:hypothetical protein